MKLVPTSMLSLFAVAAFAGGSANDPIIGSYTVTATLFVEQSVFGIPVESHVSTETHDYEFLAGNKATLDDAIHGTWKKKGQKYAANFSKSYTEEFAKVVVEGVTNVKVKYKLKKINQGDDFGIAGMVDTKIEVMQDGLDVTFLIDGYFTGATPKP